MYKNSTFFQITVIVLTLTAGVFIGFIFGDFDIPIKWNAELKAGDLIATFIGLITFVFAYKGIADNRKSIELSFQPVLYEHCSFLDVDNEFKIELKNAGIGSALNCVFTYYIDGDELPDKKLDEKLKSFCKKESKAVLFMGKGKVIFSSDSITIASVAECDREEYLAITSFLTKRFSYTVTFKDGLDKLYTQYFKAG
ncbi:hypothetical protein PTRA_a2695 [Pseudoalteromonas translucida KMM 520]|uniref:Uncharacterized protein n=2 Tax=Pseudoalteromonas translucida TaxID=166935 RepID=A0A0U2ISX7_9GAMM|nr:hypothetical protein PTRA_a2695 [Pseudoalteromonas translucida KMM 520]